MISEEDRSVIVDLATRYKVLRVLLFGSSADPESESNDIDLAIEGVAPERFFRFYGDLLFGLSKPVDVIDLSRESKFTRMVRREGVPVYVRSQ